jgi:TRAP-type mannitol/chloroaromatic compound transport system permease large subunit
MGFVMLFTLGMATLFTGLPVWELLVGIAGLFALGAWLAGIFPLSLMGLLAGRIFGLLENDLLQAIPLYVFMGVLLQQTGLAKAMLSTLAWVCDKTVATRGLSVLFLGAMVSPMNGSVASSASLLSRLVEPEALQLQPPQALALISASSTVGVVVPPSLVLILLGDVMLRAHTEASNMTPGLLAAGGHVINTQDLFHAALLPAALVFVTWALWSWWQLHQTSPTNPPLHLPDRASLTAAVFSMALIIGLLVAVFTGKLYAVEAAATGCVTLWLYALFKLGFNVKRWSMVFHDCLSHSGALMALLIGATTFSLVFRLFESDKWLINVIAMTQWPAGAVAALILIGLMACAWVLDAFEMVFVMIPIVAPGLIIQLGDAQQAGVLMLMVLQWSFLMPPMGYAVLLARRQKVLAHLSNVQAWQALLPYGVCVGAVLLAVFFNPAWVHALDKVSL